jgi:prepilin-type N-terminal cleavage/methylation domain-containing protein
MNHASCRPRTAAGWSRRGLTLTELLVGVALSSVLILAVFAFSQGSSRNFQVQTDTGAAIDQLNFAMDLVKADLRRSAFLSVPNAGFQAYPNGIIVCGRPPGTILHAMSIQDGGSPWSPPLSPRGSSAVMVPDGVVRMPDQLTLLGAFRAERLLPVTITQPGVLRAEHQLGAGFMLTAAEVDAVVGPMFQESLLAIYSRTDAVQFTRVGTGATAQAVSGQTDLIQIPYRDAVVDFGGELCDFGSPWTPGRRVVPLHFVRYRIERDFDTAGSTVFVREELGIDGTVLDRTVVSNNVVDFQVWLDRRQGEVGQPLQTIEASTRFDTDLGSMPLNQYDGSATARPELARFAHIQMSSRLQNAIPGLALGPNTGAGIRDRIEVFEYEDDGSTIATNRFTRVLTVRAEVELTNFALAD